MSTQPDKLIEMTGKIIGRWTVIRRSTKTDARKTVFWLCRCECGTTRAVRGKALRTGKSTSCGCKVREHHDKVMGAWFPGAEQRRQNFKRAA